MGKRGARMKSIKESSNQEVRKVLTYGFHDSRVSKHAKQEIVIVAQLSSFTVDVLSDLNAFHRSTVHSLQGDSSRYLQFYTILNPGGFPRDKI
uniref:Uncharacterized protein n=1 Tax=Oryza barthii TaxID=65489 RepID=A0A0D3GJG6_9ORYZ